MKKRRVSGIIDGILTFLAAGFLSVAAAGYFTRDTAAILCAGLTGGLAVAYFAALFRERREPCENAGIREAMTQLIYNGKPFALGLFKSALEKTYAVEDCGDYLLAEGVTAVFVRPAADKLTAANLAPMYAACRKRAKRLLCFGYDGADKDCRDLIDVLPEPAVTVFDHERAYAFLKSRDALPPVEIVLKPSRSRGGGALRHALAPDKSRRYTVAALVLLLSSFIMPRSVYYIIVASLCLAAAVLSGIDITKRLKKRSGAP
ncbi:MAG: hypothetical protein LBP26_07175 [Clostridiales bacterium]|jgi:hypothetical protein|nr:hypothetical protein [Clostridiales bacterium]